MEPLGLGSVLGGFHHNLLGLLRVPLVERLTGRGDVVAVELLERGLVFIDIAAAGKRERQAVVGRGLAADLPQPGVVIGGRTRTQRVFQLDVLTVGGHRLDLELPRLDRFSGGSDDRRLAVAADRGKKRGVKFHAVKTAGVLRPVNGRLFGLGQQLAGGLTVVNVRIDHVPAGLVSQDTQGVVVDHRPIAVGAEGHTAVAHLAGDRIDLFAAEDRSGAQTAADKDDRAAIGAVIAQRLGRRREGAAEIHRPHRGILLQRVERLGHRRGIDPGQPAGEGVSLGISGHQIDPAPLGEAADQSSDRLFGAGTNLLAHLSRGGIDQHHHIDRPG